MKISKNQISFTSEEVFDVLRHKNYHLWCDAIDLIGEYAQQCFEQKFEDANCLKSPVDNGINFENNKGAIYFEI